MLCREKNGDLLLDVLKTRNLIDILNGKFNPQMNIIKIFSKIGALYFNFDKRAGRPPHSASSYTSVCTCFLLA